MKVYRLGVWLVILLLIWGAAVQTAGAQDGGEDSISVAEIVEAVHEAEEAPPAWQDTMQDVLWGVGYGSAIVVLFALAVAALAVLALLIKWLLAQYVAIDAALAPFGRSPYGNALYSAIRQGYTHIDDPSDPLIQRASGLVNAAAGSYFGDLLKLYTKVLPDSPELLSPEQLSEAARTVLNGISELVNGEPLPADADPKTLMNEWRAAMNEWRQEQPKG